MRYIESTEAGFFANLCDALRHIYLADLDGESWYVNWGSNSNYFDRAIGPNAFEYFFKQGPKPEGLRVDPDIKIVRGYTEIPVKGFEFRNLFSTLIEQHLKLQDRPREIIESVSSKNNINRSTLGVHVRYTDKFIGSAYGEPSSAEPLPRQLYVNLARHGLTKLQYENIFLATDDERTADLFIREFGNDLVIIDGPRSKTTEPVHTGHPNVSGHLKGLSVLVDTYLLARCGYLIRGTSNVSSFAQFIENNLNHFNVNEVLMGDNREREYGLSSINYKDFL